MAAVLACWDGAVLSHRSAAALLGAAFGAGRTGRCVDVRRRGRWRIHFLRLCRRHGLPAPEVNVRVGRWTVDFLWRRERVAVETDFDDYHRGRVAFQDDHARDLDLRRQGLDVHRFSESQVNDRPAEVAADLREALALSS